MKEISEMTPEEMQEEIKYLREAMEAGGLLIRPVFHEEPIMIKNFVDPYENVDILRVQIPLSELEEIKKHCINRTYKHEDEKCKKCRYRSKIEVDACMFHPCIPCEWR